MDARSKTDFFEIFNTYQEILINLATKKVKDEILIKNRSIRFDLQGHVLVEINNADVINELKKNGITIEEEINDLLSILKINNDTATFCNLDVRNTVELEKSFEKWLTSSDKLLSTDIITLRKN